MNQEIPNTQKAIVKNITVKHIVEEQPDLSFLGEFSNTQGEYPIHHSDDRNTLKYFNAANVENMTQAKENYDLMMKFENGSIYMMGIEAIAEIHIPIGNKSFSIQHITSVGLWGIESNSSKDYIKEIESEQISEVKDYLKVLGCQDIDLVPIEYKD